MNNLGTCGAQHWQKKIEVVWNRWSEADAIATDAKNKQLPINVIQAMVENACHFCHIVRARRKAIQASSSSVRLRSRMVILRNKTIRSSSRILHNQVNHQGTKETSVELKEKLPRKMKIKCI